MGEPRRTRKERQLDAAREAIEFGLKSLVRGVFQLAQAHEDAAVDRVLAGIGEEKICVKAGEAAEMLSITPQTLAKYVERGLLERVEADGQVRLYSVAELRRFAADETPEENETSEANRSRFRRVV